MYEKYYNQLLTGREEFWQTISLSQRNHKLNRLILYANACGIDLVEFMMEYEGPKAELAIKKAKPVLQKQTQKHEEKQKAFFKCPFCEFVTESQKSLSGHFKKHSKKYEIFSLKSNQNNGMEKSNIEM